MNKKIFGLVFAICLMISGGVFTQNVNAAGNVKDEMEANLVGTLSKVGDSVSISIKQAYENKYVKYVSSTDDTVIVYTDSDKKRPNLYIYDKDGNYVRKCIGNINDPMKTGSEYNIGTLVKVKKGSTYYFECGMEDEITDNYNIKVAKVPEGYDYGCSVWVYERNTNTGYETSHALDLENYKNVGLTYDKKTKVFTLNNYKGNNGFYIYGYPDILSDEPVVEIKVVGENVIKSSCINEGIIKIDAPVKITGNGTLTFDDYKDASDSESYQYRDGIYSTYDLTIDGPVINFDYDYSNTIMEVFGKLTLQNGKININGGKGGVYIGLYATTMEINGGEINSNRETFYGILSARLFKMNGGTINAVVKCTEKTNTPNNNCYRAVFYGSDIVINDGVIIVQYEDTDIDKDKIDFENPILAGKSATINDGNIFIVIPDNLKELLPKDIVGTYGTNTEKPIIKISKNVNIVTGSSRDIIKIPKKEAEVKPEGQVVVTKFAVKNLKYKVLKAGTKDGKNIGEVSVVGVKKKTVKKISVGAFVTYDGVKYKVVSIGNKAFKKLKNLKKVTIGKNVRTIGANAFYGDKKLTKVIIKSKKLKKVGKNAIKKTSKKLVITVPKKNKKSYAKKFRKAGNKKVVVK